MAAIREVSDDSQASGQPAGGCITPQNQPASVSQTIVDKQHQSCEEDEVICLHLHVHLHSLVSSGYQFSSYHAAFCYLLLAFIMLFAFGFLKNCYKVIIRIRKQTHDNWL